MNHTHSPWVATKSIHGLYHIHHGSRKVASVAALPQDLEMEANAFLIAAAPDLLATCEKALKGYRNLLEFKLLPSSAYEEEIKDFIIPSMEAAIAKVKGKNQ